MPTPRIGKSKDAPDADPEAETATSATDEPAGEDDTTEALPEDAESPEADDEPAAPPKAMIPERLTINTIWCGKCGASFRRGERPDDPCFVCGTPALIREAE